MGSQAPSVRIAPKYRRSDGQDAYNILSLGGIILDPWQEDILSDWMAYKEYGNWCASTCGGSVPRQNGKSLLVQGRAEVGMILHNEQVIYTAHLQKTATETFEEMRDFFESRKLKKYVAEIKTALGREQIILKSGARIKFLARTRNGGRGQHGDLLIFDEAQELDADSQASFLPAISASRNPQTIYIGTPPDPNADGYVFREIRKKALEGKTNKTAWFEYSIKEIGDVKDKKRWADTNPALGRRILESTIEAEAEQMDNDTFARERLGFWSETGEEKIDNPIDISAWERCASLSPKPDGKTAYGVKFFPDGSAIVLAGAVIASDNTARISLIDVRSNEHGSRWLSDWLNERYTKACCVVIDGRNGTDLLTERIAPIWRMKGSVIRPSAKEAIASASLFVNEINEGTLTWFKKQDALNEAVINTERRAIGSGWGFGGDNSPLVEACALALWGVRSSKRDPARKMRIG